MTDFPAGTAPIKQEFLLSTNPQAQASAPDDDAAEGAGHVGTSRNDEDSRGGRVGKQRRSREEKKSRQGQNKNRKFGKVRDELDLCWKVASGSVCEFGEDCRRSHDIQAYLEVKPPDLRMPTVAEALAQASDVSISTDTSNTTTSSNPQKPIICPVFEEFGECRYGFKCRYLTAHVHKSSDTDTGDLVLIKDEVKKANAALSVTEVNYTTPEVQRLLRTKKYPTPIADAYLREIQETEKTENSKTEKGQVKQGVQKSTSASETPDPQAESSVTPAPAPALEQNPLAEEHGHVIIPEPEQVMEDIQSNNGTTLSESNDTPDVPVRFLEKKRLDWRGKSYLAPLTTVGNLPFRRLCVMYGAEITCGEMGLATSFLSGSKEEWSLVRRHPSEKTFGVQLAGNKPHTLVPTAEIIAKECAGNIDFVDVNCGCPIDLVFKTGSGSALLDAPGKLGRIIIGMNKALGEIPVTVKLRTGVKDGKNTSHKIMPRIGCEWNAGCISLHGRTRQQRYTKLADWGYIKQCVEAVRAREAEEDLPPVPIFGGGDCFSYADYRTSMESSGVDGVMIGRGALIKPWIFTEIKEQREWDISARERLEGIRQLAEFGLCHFGTDTSGVNATRRYLCESLSFQYRYVPIGLLERLPARINDRAPAFRGRDELETLLASPNSQDWVKISEMFLGPAPETFTFTPKHKSNAYESQG